MTAGTVSVEKPAKTQEQERIEHDANRILQFKNEIEAKMQELKSLKLQEALAKQTIDQKTIQIDDLAGQLEDAQNEIERWKRTAARLLHIVQDHVTVE